MKKLLFTVVVGFFSLSSSAQTSPQTGDHVKKEIKNREVEIACGECKFKMKGKSCDLAVLIDGKPYFVDGKSIDDFGDAHDKKHGFCNVISKANVTGEIVNNRFKATAITLLPPAKKGG